MKKHLSVLTLIFTTLGIYILTKNPITAPFKLQLALLSILTLVGFLMLYRKRESEEANSGIFTMVVTLTILFIVGATGWFYSPFFFSLYLLAILYAFIFGLGAMLAFVGTLTVLFSFNIGEVDLAYDFLVVLSLLTTIPLSIYLRREYLRLKQVQKQILILQSEQKDFKSKVEEILANKVTNFAVTIRQPINDTKQLAYQMEKLISKKDWEKDRDRIIKSSDEALTMLKDFEEDVTGRKLVSHLNKSDVDRKEKPEEETEKKEEESPETTKPKKELSNASISERAQQEYQESDPTLSKKS